MHVVDRDISFTIYFPPGIFQQVPLHFRSRYKSPHYTQGVPLYHDLGALAVPLFLKKDIIGHFHFPSRTLALQQSPEHLRKYIITNERYMNDKIMFHWILKVPSLSDAFPVTSVLSDC